MLWIIYYLAHLDLEMVLLYNQLLTLSSYAEDIVEQLQALELTCICQ